MAGSTLASPSAEPVAAVRPAALSPGRETWRRFRRHRLAMVSAVVLRLLILGVVVGPWLWAVPINEIDFS
ncbi:MAG: ABC transporter permease, partial [Bosea sp.]|nr:ABC transporter permease [Bosea sp. (in: a-proteobacteria)]